MLIVGIDPGKSGAVAVLEDRSIHEIHVMSDIHWFCDFMDSLKVYAKETNQEIKVYIEKAQAMPKNGAVSMFTYGAHYGELLGSMTALRIPFETVPPRTWTAAMHQTKSRKISPKAKSLQALHRLFPDVRLTDPRSERAKVPHIGIIDAILIAEYGRRNP